MLKEPSKRILNGLLGTVGLGIARQETIRRYPGEVMNHLLRSLADLETVLRDTQLPELPSTEGRLELMTELLGVGPLKGFYILDSLHKTLKIAGDVCEFGVAHGATSALLANEIRKTEKQLWLFDSFQGLPKPTLKDRLIDDMFLLGSIEKYEGKMSIPQHFVVERLRKIRFEKNRTHIVPGFIETTAKMATLPEAVCYAYVDFDFYEPILTALHLLHPRTVPGARIGIDDYDYFTTGARAATEEFLATYPDEYRVIAPPSMKRGFITLEKKGT